MKTVNLKSDMPQVHEAPQRLDRQLAIPDQEKAKRTSEAIAVKPDSLNA